ncbi:MAG TPA: rod shape-determining protein MreD [Acidimicrobiia bacterium]|nr:rod shape-determining protein MreD [Acidimicrobiia bacterium]
MRGRTVLIVVALLLVAVVVQTTLFGRIRLVTPDLVLLLAIVLCLTRIRPEVILAIAFTSGLVVDLLGSSVLGLRAVVFTTVAYLGLRTRDRAEIGRVAVALWAGGLTLVGVVLLMLIGTLFGQSSLLGENTFSRVILVPLANLVIAAALAPLVVRLVDRDKTAFRYP